MTAWNDFVDGVRSRRPSTMETHRKLPFDFSVINVLVPGPNGQNHVKDFGTWRRALIRIAQCHLDCLRM